MIQMPDNLVRRYNMLFSDHKKLWDKLHLIFVTMILFLAFLQTIII